MKFTKKYSTRNEPLIFRWEEFPRTTHLPNQTTVEKRKSIFAVLLTPLRDVNLDVANENSPCHGKN